MKHLKNLLAYVLVFALVLFNIPASIFADENNNADLGTVRVIIRNTTFPKANGAKWDGVLLDKKVELKNDSNAISVIADAVKSENLTITGVETNYVTEIAGLSAYDGGSMSGFMGTVNDWFANEGLDAFKVSNGKLVAGDEVCMEYSCAWGGDIGSVWNDNSTELTELTFSAGILNEDFQPATKEYTLSIPKDVTSVAVTAMARNKNFQVRTYKNAYTPTENGSEIRRNTEIPVTEGDKLYIGVGDTSWPSMNGGQTASKYTVNIVYQEEAKPAPDFEKFELSAVSLNGWTSGETFDKETASYDIQIKNYSTSTISISSDTTYDENQFTATAKYTDSNQDAREIEIKNEGMTSLNNLPFGNTQIVIEISDKTDAENKKQYTLNVFRPYDTTAELNTRTGIKVVPEGRELLATKYKEQPEGTMFKVEDGVITTSGMSSDVNDYETYLLENPENFSLTLTGKTNYVHIRVREDKSEFTEITSGENTPVYSFANAPFKKITIQVISDEEYVKNGFTNVAELGKEYTVTVVKAEADTNAAKIQTAQTIADGAQIGDWYPAFNSNVYSHVVVMNNEDEYPELTFSVNDGSVVTYNREELQADENGIYHIQLKSGAQKITVFNNGIENTYSFRVQKKSKYDVPDKVVDYLPINSQYTNRGPYGLDPTVTLGGTIVSLGNAGGYITYYYDNAIKNDPANKYGVDFYVYGNSMGVGSFSEPGQVYVSEDGVNFYALAGSEHYEDSTIRDYEITYTKTANGKTAWTDNRGGSNDGTTNSGMFPIASNYFLNKNISDSITIKTILLPSAAGTLYGDGTTSAFATAGAFGYSDVYKNGTIGADANPYNGESNGFDLALAVDENGDPVDFPNGIHYIKVATASNIWAGVFGEKSTEVGYVIRTTAAEENVGVTTAPQSVKITDESGKETEIALETDKQVYQVAINDSKNIKVSLNGAQAEDNIFVNNKKIAADESADITVGDNGKTVRVLVQNDEKEPVVFIFHITSSSEEKTQHIFEETTKSLLAGETPVVASIGGEWVVTGLARAGKISDEFKTGYFKNVYDTVKANGTEKLSNTKSTDNSRVILALTSLGYDVTDIAGQNLLKPLSDYEYVTKQGVNGAIYALLALDSAKYEIPENTYDTIQTTRENLIQNILAYKLENSGFSFDGETADVDITAMALQALAPYADTYVSEIEDAVSYLSSAQNEDGSYGYQGTSNTESTAQVVLALTTNNINPRTDDRFIKNGTSAYTALLNFFVEDGFAHEFAGERNQMSTEQAYLGLVSYIRYQNTEDTIYDMSKVEKSENIVYPDEQPKNPDDNKPDDKKSDDKKSDDKKLDDKKSDDKKSDDKKSDDKKSDDKKSDDKKTNNKKSDDKSSVKQSTDNQSVAKADNTSAAKNPKTGDNNAALLFVTIMLISATTIISARKKKNV